MPSPGERGESGLPGQEGVFRVGPCGSPAPSRKAPARGVKGGLSKGEARWVRVRVRV